MKAARHLNINCSQLGEQYALLLLCGVTVGVTFGSAARPSFGFARPDGPESGERYAVSASGVDCGKIQSTILGRSVAYCIDYPADYGSSSKPYAALYFLHGLFENEQSWIDRGGKQILDDLRSRGEIGNFLVVLPDGGTTFYVNSVDGRDRYEDFFIQELVPFMDRNYRTIPKRDARGISGTSMGGYGALHLAMRHPEIFGSAAAQSPALMPNIPSPAPADDRWNFYARVLAGPFGSPLSAAYWDANNPIKLAEHPERFTGLKVYFDCGDHDRYGFQEGAQLLDKILSEKQFPHEFFLRSGNHGWSYLSQYMKHALLFEWRSFGQGVRPDSRGRASGKLQADSERRKLPLGNTRN